MIDKSFRFVVTESSCTSLKVGDVVNPIKQQGDYVLIGHSYHKSLPFELIDSKEYVCFCALTPGRVLARIERVK